MNFSVKMIKRFTQKIGLQIQLISPQSETEENNLSQEITNLQSLDTFISKVPNHQNQLVSLCFEPSQPQSITSGLNTNFTLSPSHSFHKSSYQKSCFFQPLYIPWALNTGTCIWQGDLFYSVGLHRNRCQPQPHRKKSGEILEKMQVNGLEEQK